jgi:hypothetical protein
MSYSRRAHVLFLAAVFLAGFGRIALLPPFEGADETAHYSRILATAFPPDKIEDVLRIDKSVFDYYPNGPMSTGWLRNVELQKHDPRVKAGKDAAGVFSDYHDFFDKPGMMKKYKKLYRNSPVPRGFSPSPPYDWEVQHPPAYYALLGFICRHLPDMTLQGCLFALRGLGFLIAFAGFAVGVEATARHLAMEGRKDAAAISAFGAFYPFMMPSFFNDITRLGNDTLALAAFSAIWVFLLRHMRKPDDSSEWLGLGVAMGLALLVKATMAAPVCGILLFVALRNIRANSMKGVASALTAGGLAALISSKWYVLFLSGHAIASSGASVFAKGLGKPFSMAVVLSSAAESLYGAITHFSDWMYVRFNPAVRIALGLPAVMAGCAWALTLIRKKNLFSEDTLPFWATGPLLGALAAHSVFTALAYNTDLVAPTAAYYAHTTAPALALCIGLGMARMRGWLMGRTLCVAVGLGALWGTAYVFLRQAQMYAGCWWDDAAKMTTSQGPCFHDFFLMFRHLEVLSWPLAGTVFLASGFSCAVAGLAMIAQGRACAPAEQSP